MAVSLLCILLGAERSVAATHTIAAAGDTIAARHLINVLSSASPEDEVHVIGAGIAGEGVLPSAPIQCAVYIVDSEFLGPVQAESTRFENYVRFNGTLSSNHVC